MKIAILGTRGVPSRYGGFETFAEEVGKRLVERGHEVWVYCRSGYYQKQPEEYCGIRLVYIPEVRTKTLETLKHTYLSLKDAVKQDFDLIFICNVANSPLLVLPALKQIKTLVHVDGLDWKRDKWSLLGKAYYIFSELVACIFPGALVADSLQIKKYYKKRYGRELHFASYGAECQDSREPALLHHYGLEPGNYFLQITRFEPENNPYLTLKAFLELKTDKKLVVVGGTQYNTPYTDKIFSVKHERILLPGFLYEPDILRELRTNAYSYIHGNEVGGTNPGLLQAMASGCFVISRDVAYNREVLKDAGIYFQKSMADLREKMEWALQNPQKLQEMSAAGREFIKINHEWDNIVTDYEKIFHTIVK